MNSYDRIYTLLLEGKLPSQYRKGKHGEEAEEIQATLPYKGQRKKGAEKKTTIYKGGSEEHPADERETLPWRGSRRRTKDAPFGHQIPTRQAKKAIAQAKAAGAKHIPEKELTGQSDAKPGGKYLNPDERAERAKAHGREPEKQTPEWQKELSRAVKSGKTPPSTAVEMPGGKKQQTGGRTRHAGGKDPDEPGGEEGPGNVHDIVSAKWERKWAKSAERRNRAEKGGKLEKIRAALPKGKKMRESLLQAFQLGRKV
tara:strand:- start:34 stop:801 length:768 start_codon:yes stop_codon:yes gene_type:complete